MGKHWGRLFRRKKTGELKRDRHKTSNATFQYKRGQKSEKKKNCRLNGEKRRPSDFKGNVGSKGRKVPPLLGGEKKSYNKGGREDGECQKGHPAPRGGEALHLGRQGRL